MEVSVRNGSITPSNDDILLEIPKQAIKRLKKYYLVDCEDDIQDIWNCVVSHWEMNGLPQIRKPQGWSAALELYYRTREDLPVNKTEMAASWQISYSTMMKNFHFINQLIDEFWDQMNL